MYCKLDTAIMDIPRSFEGEYNNSLQFEIYRQSSHVLVFCVNFERHICTHSNTSIKCYMVSLRYVHVPLTYISCQSNWHVYISTYFQNVNKSLTLHSSLQKIRASKNSLIYQHMNWKLDTAIKDITITF